MAEVAAPAPAPSPFATEDFVTSAITDVSTGGPYIDTNTQYLLSSAYLVFFMHCGFAMVRPLCPDPLQCWSINSCLLFIAAACLAQGST